MFDGKRGQAGRVDGAYAHIHRNMFCRKPIDRQLINVNFQMIYAIKILSYIDTIHNANLINGNANN